MPAIPQAHVEAAYKVGKNVYAGKIGPTQGIKQLADIGLNAASATFFIYNLRNMLAGELYQRAMSVEATRAFLQWIYRDFGDDGLKNALRALERHIPYFRQSSPSPMRGHKQLLTEFGRKIRDHTRDVQSSQSDPAGWIFQGNNDRFRVDDYVRDSDEIWWSINQAHFERFVKVDQPAFIWRSKGRGEKPAGIIAICRITHGPIVAKEERKALPYYHSRPPKNAYLQVGMRIEKRFVEPNEMLIKEAIAADLALRDMRILRMPAGTNYPLNAAQCSRLFQLCGSVKSALRPQYRDFGEAPNDDLTALRQFAAKVRRGQDRFRKNLLRLYAGSCAITGCRVESVLEACHIWEHTSSGINRADNGLLLRSDIHCLFDCGLVSVEPDSLIIQVSKALEGTEYWQYNGRSLARRVDGSEPSAEYMAKRTAVESRSC